MQDFRNDDPAHALVNPLRRRRDRPHMWFQDGFWRVSPFPNLPGHRDAPLLDEWHRAHRHAGLLNWKLQWEVAQHAEAVIWRRVDACRI